MNEELDDEELFDEELYNDELEGGLEACPFCGGTNIHFGHELDKLLNDIFCHDCAIAFSVLETETWTPKDTATGWNRRAIRPPRRWGSGSEPPNGMYIVYNDRGRASNVRMIYTGSYVDEYYQGLWLSIVRGSFLWGPLPEPVAER